MPSSTVATLARSPLTRLNRSSSLQHPLQSQKYFNGCDFHSPLLALTWPTESATPTSGLKLRPTSSHQCAAPGNGVSTDDGTEADRRRARWGRSAKGSLPFRHRLVVITMTITERHCERMAQCSTAQITSWRPAYTIAAGCCVEATCLSPCSRRRRSIA